MASACRAFFLLAIFSQCVPSAVAQPEKMSEKIVKFCKDHLGKKVGEGECTDLADAALQSAGAKRRTAFKEHPNKDDYVWGELVYALEIQDNSQKETKVPKRTIQPGDVIQFRDARFEGTKLRGFDIYRVSCPHHTAVVLAVKEDNMLSVLEQNINGKKVVVENTYRLTDLKTGWVRIYRPVEE